MTEQQLIQQVQNGDTSAFGLLVEKHRRNVYFLALDLSGNSQDADDLTQEAFIKAFRYIQNFRGESKFGSWVYRITVNCFIDFRRKKRLQTISIHDDEKAEAGHSENLLPDMKNPKPDAKITGGDLQIHIKKALESLAPRERSVFVLRHYQEMPLKEIATILEIAEGTVKSLLFRAVKRLQVELAVYQ